MDDTRGTLWPVIHLCGLQLPVEGEDGWTLLPASRQLQSRRQGPQGNVGVGGSATLPTPLPFQPLDTSSWRGSHSTPQGLDSEG